MGWFHQVKNPKLKNVKKLASNTPVGLWKKCNQCGEILQTDKLEENLSVCPLCDYHYRISAYERIAVMTDDNSFQEISPDLISNNPLEFQDKMPYAQRLRTAIKTTGIKDSTVCGTATIDGKEVALAVMDFRFMGGSMGVVTGEKVALAMDIGYDKKIPVIVVSCSGGARMQEGILSLMQMAKTSASRSRLKNAGLPYISMLTDPTTGGCAASFAMLGDINISEPKALTGFIPEPLRDSLDVRGGPHAVTALSQKLREPESGLPFSIGACYGDDFCCRKVWKRTQGSSDPIKTWVHDFLAIVPEKP